MMAWGWNQNPTSQTSGEKYSRLLIHPVIFVDLILLIKQFSNPISFNPLRFTFYFVVTLSIAASRTGGKFRRANQNVCKLLRIFTVSDNVYIDTENSFIRRLERVRSRISIRLFNWHFSHRSCTKTHSRLTICTLLPDKWCKQDEKRRNVEDGKRRARTDAAGKKLSHLPFNSPIMHACAAFHSIRSIRTAVVRGAGNVK